MKNLLVKKVHLFFTLFFIFLLHLPFVYAKSKVSNFRESNAFTTPQLLVNNLSVTAASQKTINASLYDSLRLGSLGLGKHVFEYAMMGYNKLKLVGSLDNDQIISIVDFSKPSG